MGRLAGLCSSAKDHRAIASTNLDVVKPEGPDSTAQSAGAPQHLEREERGHRNKPTTGKGNWKRTTKYLPEFWCKGSPPETVHP
ncbi:UNVERIFIED_CONTAM: hypothetical protein FKN15_071285 [Acipenser sinensis]